MDFWEIIKTETILWMWKPNWNTNQVVQVEPVFENAEIEQIFPHFSSQKFPDKHTIHHLITNAISFYMRKKSKNVSYFAFLGTATVRQWV